MQCVRQQGGVPRATMPSIICWSLRCSNSRLRCSAALFLSLLADEPLPSLLSPPGLSPAAALSLAKQLLACQLSSRLGVQLLQRGLQGEPRVAIQLRLCEIQTLAG